MGVVMLQTFPILKDKGGPQTVDLLTKRITALGAVQQGTFCVDLESHVIGGLNKTIHVLHDTERPSSVFAVLENSQRSFCVTSDNLMDLLISKITSAYGTKKTTRIECRGPRFEVLGGDFLIKIGSVTIAQSFKGILCEVEYQPCAMASECWDLLKEFCKSFLGSCVPESPSPHMQTRMTEQYHPRDTMMQYLEHFQNLRRPQPLPPANATPTRPRLSDFTAMPDVPREDGAQRHADDVFVEGQLIAIEKGEKLLDATTDEKLPKLPQLIYERYPMETSLQSFTDETYERTMRDIEVISGKIKEMFNRSMPTCGNDSDEDWETEEEDEEAAENGLPPEEPGPVEDSVATPKAPTARPLFAWKEDDFVDGEYGEAVMLQRPGLVAPHVPMMVKNHLLLLRNLMKSAANVKSEQPKGSSIRVTLDETAMMKKADIPSPSQLTEEQSLLENFLDFTTGQLSKRSKFQQRQNLAKKIESVGLMDSLSSDDIPEDERAGKELKKTILMMMGGGTAQDTGLLVDDSPNWELVDLRSTANAVEEAPVDQDRVEINEDLHSASTESLDGSVEKGQTASSTKEAKGKLGPAEGGASVSFGFDVKFHEGVMQITKFTHLKDKVQTCFNEFVVKMLLMVIAGESPVKINRDIGRYAKILVDVLTELDDSLHEEAFDNAREEAFDVVKKFATVLVNCPSFQGAVFDDEFLKVDIGRVAFLERLQERFSWKGVHDDADKEENSVGDADQVEENDDEWEDVKGDGGDEPLRQIVIGKRKLEKDLRRWRNFATRVVQNFEPEVKNHRSRLIEKIGDTEAAVAQEEKGTPEKTEQPEPVFPEMPKLGSIKELMSTIEALSNPATMQLPFWEMTKEQQPSFAEFWVLNRGESYPSP